MYSIAYDRLRKRCASGSLDNTVKIWDVVSGECLATFTGHTSLVGLLGLSPNHIVSGAADASLRIWDANTHKLKHILQSHGGAISCFQHDETKVISGADGTLKLWDIQSGAYVRDLVMGITSVWQIALNGSRLVAASNRQNSTVYDVFDFGTIQHPSGVDDDRLDRIRPPPWEQQSADPPKRRTRYIHAERGSRQKIKPKSRPSIENAARRSPRYPARAASAGEVSQLDGSFAPVFDDGEDGGQQGGPDEDVGMDP